MTSSFTWWDSALAADTVPGKEAPRRAKSAPAKMRVPVLLMTARTLPSLPAREDLRSAFAAAPRVPPWGKVSCIMLTAIGLRPKMRRGSFKLSKWYLDCVTEAGDCFAAYSARLSWGPMRLRYTAVVGGHATFTRQPEPLRRDGVVAWKVPALKISGRWSSLDRPLQASLLDASVDWSCVAPRAEVEVTVAGRTFTGLGYVEHLTLTKPPWALPLQELRWGRFLSASDALVWIECIGPEPEHVVWRNGIRQEEEPQLKMEEPRVIRSGTLGDALFATHSRLRKVFPQRILKTKETKWLGRTTLGDSSGWALYENVRWP